MPPQLFFYFCSLKKKTETVEKNQWAWKQICGVFLMRTEWEEEHAAKQLSKERSAHYLDVYKALRDNVETKRMIMAKEQLIAELGFDTGTTRAAVLKIDELADEDEKQRHAQYNAKNLHDKLAQLFAEAAQLHATLLEMKVLRSLIFPADDTAPTSSSSAATPIDPKSRAAELMKTARSEIGSLEKRILLIAARKKGDWAAATTERASSSSSSSSEMEELISQRIGLVTRLCDDISTCLLG